MLQGQGRQAAYTGLCRARVEREDVHDRIADRVPPPHPGFIIHKVEKADSAAIRVVPQRVFEQQVARRRVGVALVVAAFEDVGGLAGKQAELGRDGHGIELQEVNVTRAALGKAFQRIFEKAPNFGILPNGGSMASLPAGTLYLEKIGESRPEFRQRRTRVENRLSQLRQFAVAVAQVAA